MIDWASFRRHKILAIHASVKIEARSGYDLATKTAEYELMLRFNAGDGEQALDVSSPLARAFRRALAQGHPPDHWKILTCEDDPALPPRVLGTFAQTRVGRVLFFPAVGTRIGKGIRQPSIFEGDSLDHLTLDPLRGDRHLSHLAVVEASRRAKTRGQDFSFPVESQRELIYWFSVLTQDLDAYPRLPRMLRVRFSSGKPSIKDLAPEFATRLGVTPVPMPTTSYEPSFMQLDVWAGRADEQGLKQLKPVPYATHPELASDAPAAPYSLFAHAVEVPLVEDAGLVVMLWRPRARIPKPMIMRARLPS